MTVIRGGYDTHVNSAYPNAHNGTSHTMRLLFGSIRGLLYMPLQGVRGMTVVAAELTGHVGPGGLPAGTTLTFAPVVESWSAGTATWTNQPDLLGTGSATFTTVAGLAAGAEFAVPVTTAIQSVSTGTAWYGWRVTASSGAGTVQLVTFDAAAIAWTLTVDLSEAPQQPTMLAPNGAVVGRSKPTLTWDFTDLGASGSQYGARVQVDPGADGITPDFDSGFLTIKDPELDLSATAYAGLAPNASDQWRVFVRDESGNDSDWSDWAPFTYVPQPTVTLLSPAAGVLWDPTAEILASVSPATMVAFGLRVTAGDDRTNILYDSHKQPASDPALVGFELPAKNESDNRILIDDSDYQLAVRVYDDEDRQATPGDPIYTEVWSTFHFDDDLALTPVATTSAHQVGTSPNVRITWTRASAADKWVILCDDQIIATLLPEDTVSGVSTYSWLYDSATPHRRHVYKVKAISDERQSAPGPSAVLTTDVKGLWLVSAHGSVRMQGTDVDGFRAIEKRATYKMLRGPDVDVIFGFGGVAADEVTFTIRNREDQSFAEAEEILLAIKADPTTPVRMVWGAASIPVLLRNLLPLPSSDMQPEDMRHRVSFGFWQVAEFGDTP